MCPYKTIVLRYLFWNGYCYDMISPYKKARPELQDEVGLYTIFNMDGCENYVLVVLYLCVCEKLCRMT